jgi:pimeloyl-ACP methyl ester carboxylesterase
MHHVNSTKGTRISFEKQGSGHPLVLVHGGFSDHRTNWEFVLPQLSEHFTTYAIARRGRGETDATEGHTVQDEIEDVVTLIDTLGEPVSLVGHSYGAHVALGAASLVPSRIRKLVLYEAPRPGILSSELLASLTPSAQAGDWDGFSFCFFRDALLVPEQELDALRRTELWAPILSDAKATLGDLFALSRYEFWPERFTGLRVPVLLQTGSESPRHLYVTDALLQCLPDVSLEILEGQAHEGMTTAPTQYSDSIIRFLTDTMARVSHA